MSKKEKRGGYLGDHEGFDFASVGNVWANAEVDHRTAAVYGGGGTVWNFGLDEVFLVFVVLTRVEREGKKMV